MRLFGFLRNVHCQNELRKEKSCNDVETKVQKWLLEEGFEVRKRSNDNFTFRFLVSKERLPKFSVSKFAGKTGSIFIESGVSFLGLNKEKAFQVFDQRQELFWVLRQHLVSKEFSYEFSPANADTNYSGGIIFGTPLYYDRLVKADFLKSITKVINTTIFIFLSIRRYCGQRFMNDKVRSYLA